MATTGHETEAINVQDLKAALQKLKTDKIDPKVDKTTTVNGHALSGNVTVSKSDVGLGSVTNDAQVKRSEMGAASGVATLDSAGKVPSSQLPSYVDDVLEYDTKSAFPATGEGGKIYVDKSTNTSWRWSGSAYTQIKGDLAIGTTTGTAADGKVVNDHINNTSNPHGVTKVQVGLGDVVNTGDSATPVSGGTTKFTTGGAYTELAKKVDKVTGKGLSTNDYTTDEKNKLGGIEAGAQKHIAPTAAEVKSALGTGSGTSKYLREDGTWQTPEGDYEEQIDNLQQSVKEIQTNMSYAIDSIVSNFTLEGSSSPTFTVNNQGAAAQYINRMGGYLFLVKDGKVYAAKLNPSNWSLFADGSTVTDAAKAATECMIHVPDCHYLGNGTTLQFGGMTPINGGHVFASPHWVGAYQMSAGGHSRAGVGSSHSKTMSAFWQDAQAIHADFGLANYQFHCLINALYQARYGNLNSESFLSNGNARSSASWDAYRDLAHGMADSLGDGTGCVTATDRANVTRYVTKLFGFEDMFGKLWEFRPGIRFYMSGSVRHAVVYDGNVVSNTAEGRDISGVLSSANGQYATQMELGEYWDMLPKAVGGSETTYYCDGYWAATGGQLLVVGGPAYLGSPCGLSSASSDRAFSGADVSVGARLAFYSEPEIVSGAELLSMLA
ncbi:hypothetical protein SAMN04487851_11439 [Prevotella sp. tc2-28]|uniref:hypothetical protein n=1 Tax=Prevotella sp. tc2-28 TaxID=1761888 RepID=UPI00089A7528|nr:hypothetical protein [Prevotella sp. tc2-28]SEA79197.1 hypothetical protein SAMN04487851_11439 [Prevotella sp. tc2-28]